MEHTTFLEATGNLIGFLIFVIIPLVLVIMLVIKNPQTTLRLIKAVFKLLMSAGKFIAPFIMLMFKYFAPNGAIGTIIFREEVLSEMKKMNRQHSSDDGYSTSDVDPVIKYQNGVDGAERY